MKSPFAIFRKHQKVLTVVLTGMAMFAFIIMGQMDPNSTSLPMILGIVLGGAAFWLFGSTRGSNPLSLVVTGAVVGGALGIILPRFIGPAAAVETSIGRISEQELSEMIAKRRLANKFLSDAYSRSVPPPDIEQWNDLPEQFRNMLIQNAYGQWQARLSMAQFRFDYSADQSEEATRQDVVTGYLFRHEADQMGIAAGDEAVNEYIIQLTEGNLSRDDFHDIRKQLNLSETELYDILRDEIKAKKAAEILAPRVATTPEEYWDFYQKLNVTAQAETVAIPVDSFVDSIEEPSTQDLVAFFEKYKTRFPAATESGEAQIIDPEPEFGQPRKVSVAYVEADYVTIEDEIAKNTPDEQWDQLTRDYYDEHPNEFLDSFSSSSSSLDFDLGDFSTESDDDTDAGGPALEFGVDPTESGEQDAADESEPTEGEESGGPSLGSANESDIDPDEECGDEGPALGGLTEPQGSAADASESQSADEQQDEFDPTAGLTIEVEDPSNDGPPPPALPSLASDPAGSTPTLRSYDEVKDEIRDQLLREMTQAEMQKRISTALTQMRDLGYRRTLEEDDPQHLSDQQVAAELQTWAQNNGLRYVETGLLSYLDLGNSDEHPIGRATEPSAQLGSNAPTVAERLFRSSSNTIYMSDQAVDRFLTSNQFAYWATEYKDRHVPTLDEPGVKEQVVEAWKIAQARSKAEERAKAIAALIDSTEAGQDSATEEEEEADGTEATEDAETEEPPETSREILDGQTVTGQEGSLPLTPLTTSQFSWLSRNTPSAPGLNPFEPPPGPPVRMSEVSSVENAGPDFMETVFQQLKVGETGVAPNADHSIYYAIKLLQRTPADDGATDGLQNLQNGFLTSDVPFGREFQALAGDERQQIFFDWRRNFLDGYAVRFAETQPAPN